jgi:hypothetical protein
MTRRTVLVVACVLLALAIAACDGAAITLADGPPPL